MSRLARRQQSTGKLDVQRARELLQSTRDIGVVMEIRDAAKLGAEFLRLRGETVGAINDAQRLLLQAQAKLGRFLRENVRRGRPGKNPDSSRFFSLNDIGIDEWESGRCQKLAQLDDDGELEPAMDRIAARGEKITAKGALSPPRQKSSAGTFHTLVASGEFMDSLTVAARRLAAKWPDESRHLLPELVRRVAGELALEWGDAGQ